MNASSARHRTTRVPTRVRPHLRRRNGIVDGPQVTTHHSGFQHAVSIGWRPSG